ncbi:hypothetical protein LINGRAHAP2_LOCUS10428 [Linum grandiflorum]
MSLRKNCVFGGFWSATRRVGLHGVWLFGSKARPHASVAHLKKKINFKFPPPFSFFSFLFPFPLFPPPSQPNYPPSPSLILSFLSPPLLLLPFPDHHPPPPPLPLPSPSLPASPPSSSFSLRSTPLPPPLPTNPTHHLRPPYARCRHHSAAALPLLFSSSPSSQSKMSPRPRSLNYKTIALKTLGAAARWREMMSRKASSQAPESSRAPSPLIVSQTTESPSAIDLEKSKII